MEEFYETEFDGLVNRIKAYNAKLDVDFLKRAYSFSYEAHQGQLRRSGEPYFQHCIEVAKILASLRLDTATIASGLLHDVIEDTEIKLTEVEEKFGAEVAVLVSGVGGIRRLKTLTPNGEAGENFIENYIKMLLSVVKDIRVILIKLADRVHNMRTLKYLSEKKQREIAIETREIYVSLANRLGLTKIKSDLEDFTFKFLNNGEYKKLAKKVNEKRQQREDYIQSLVEAIGKKLSNDGMKARIEGRPKSLFSIFQKSQNRNLAFEEMYDLFAIRIIVEKLEDCYQALSIVHGNFEHRPDKFYDYIDMPKPNGYRSLHTVIFSKEDKLVEIQIRTEEMHRVAEDGIAAHWKYKEGKLEDNQLAQYLADFRQWLRQLAESFHEAKDEANDVLEHLKIDLFKNEIFVYTPQGDVIKLPKDSTPLDFAFAVHTDIGLHCLGAKIGGKMAPLDYKLKSGETIEIITSANQKPNLDWLNFVRTSRAAAKIKHWFKISIREQSRKLGEMILQDELKRLKVKKSDCKNRLQLMKNSERNLEVDWEFAADPHFQVRLNMVGHDRKNFLHHVSAAIAKTRTNIVSVNMNTQDSFIQGHIVIEVKNLLHLTQVINKISKVNGVINVERLDGAGEFVAMH